MTASHPEPRRDFSSLSPGAHSTGREHVSRLTPGRFLDAALVAVCASLALFAGAFGAWFGGLHVAHLVMPAGLSCAAASCAAVALSRLSERRSRAAREPSE